jgi:hypothetical protein
MVVAGKTEVGWCITAIFKSSVYYEVAASLGIGLDRRYGEH